MSHFVDSHSRDSIHLLPQYMLSTMHDCQVYSSWKYYETISGHIIYDYEVEAQRS